MIRLEEIKKRYEAAGREDIPWLVETVEQLRDALNEGFNKLSSKEHQDKWAAETHALLAKLEEGK